jgi:hypothetical protein
MAKVKKVNIAVTYLANDILSKMLMEKHVFELWYKLEVTTENDILSKN